MTRRTWRVLAAACISAVALSACGGGGGDGGERIAHGSARVGPGPAAREVCNTMVRESVPASVGLPLAAEPVSAVRGDVFSCNYLFDGGSLELSVRDLHTLPQAREYFTDLKKREGVTETLSGLAEGGFTRSDGSVVAMKDAMILTVDVTNLPSTRLAKSDVGIDVAATVMHCW